MPVSSFNAAAAAAAAAAVVVVADESYYCCDSVPLFSANIFSLLLLSSCVLLSFPCVGVAAAATLWLARGTVFGVKGIAGEINALRPSPSHSPPLSLALTTCPWPWTMLCTYPGAGKDLRDGSLLSCCGVYLVAEAVLCVSAGFCCSLLPIARVCPSL